MKMFHIVKAVAADDTLRSCETVIKPTHTTLPGRRQLEKTTRQWGQKDDSHLSGDYE